MCQTGIVLRLSPSLADEREACVRDMQVTTRYFIGPGKYRESLRVLRETLFRAPSSFPLTASVSERARPIFTGAFEKWAPELIQLRKGF